MQTGMLGDQEALRRVWDGPLKDLMARLNGPDGKKWETALGKFLRKELPWPFTETILRSSVREVLCLGETESLILIGGMDIRTVRQLIVRTSDQIRNGHPESNDALVETIRRRLAGLGLHLSGE